MEVRRLRRPGDGLQECRIACRCLQHAYRYQLHRRATNIVRTTGSESGNIITSQQQFYHIHKAENIKSRAVLLSDVLKTAIILYRKIHISYIPYLLLEYGLEKVTF